MKKLTLLTISAVLGLCTTSAFSQGTISFANTTTTLVTTNGPTSGQAVKTTTDVELFYQPGSNPLPAAIYNPVTAAVTQGGWEALGAVVALGPQATGRFSGGNETTGTDVAQNGGAWLTVVGWTGSAANLQAAIAAGDYVGESTVWESATGGGGSPPATAVAITATALQGTSFTGLVLTPVPEPSIIALSGLGAAGLLLFRRKK